MMQQTAATDTGRPQADAGSALAVMADVITTWTKPVAAVDMARQHVRWAIAIAPSGWIQNDASQHRQSDKRGKAVEIAMRSAVGPKNTMATVSHGRCRLPH